MNTVILIPAYKPEESFVEFSGRLREEGHPVVAVDDGGGEPFAGVFDRVEALGVTVLHHEVNRGKGRALKTGIEYINANMPEVDFIVTADCDGQHKIEDINRIIAAEEENPGVFVLGGRFRDKSVKVPFRSRMGNGFTRVIFRLATGDNIHDTQTGLRGIPKHLFGEMIKLKGERYEYEMNMLLMLHVWEQDFVEIPIETVYINNNAGSHYNAFKDSLRILREIIKFAAVSMVSFLLDYVLFLIFNAFVFKGSTFTLAGFFHVPENNIFASLLATMSLAYICARLVSGTFNYILNRKLVFKKGSGSSGLKYLVLAIGIMLAGALATGGLMRLGVPGFIAKIIVDAVLYFLSYYAQREWVFKKSSAKKNDGK